MGTHWRMSARTKSPASSIRCSTDCQCFDLSLTIQPWPLTLQDRLFHEMPCSAAYRSETATAMNVEWCSKYLREIVMAAELRFTLII